LKIRFWSLLGFAVCLTVASLRAYQYPEYSTDGFSYMGNAVAMSGASIKGIHDAVYSAAKAGIPGPIFSHLTGTDPGEPVSESRSFHDRAMNPYHFAEFLPCFAVRPLFNELVYLLRFKLGVGLLRATVVIPVVSYWLMGWIALLWISRYLALPWSAVIALLILLSNPVWELGRCTTPDALSSAVLLLAMYLVLEKQRHVAGVILLLASVFIRTDNFILVLAVLAYVYAAHLGLSARDVIVLSSLALVSVWIINHFGGDYGPRMLYYRSFIEAPTAPGEIVPKFGVHEYLVALRAGLSDALHGPYILFLLMGIVGVLARPTKAVLGLAATTALYTAAHVVIFPNPETRFFGPFFVAMGVTLVSSLKGARTNQLSDVPVLGPAAKAA
jgi:hypothetical protein